MKRDWIFTVENSVCDLRTVGVLIKDGYSGIMEVTSMLCPEGM